MSDTPTEKAIGIWEELEPRAENFWRLVRKNAPTHEIIREAQRQLEKMTDLAIYAESPELQEEDYVKIKEGGDV